MRFKTTQKPIDPWDGEAQALLPDGKIMTRTKEWNRLRGNHYHFSCECGWDDRTWAGLPAKNWEAEKHATNEHGRTS